MEGTSETSVADAARVLFQTVAGFREAVRDILDEEDFQPQQGTVRLPSIARQSTRPQPGRGRRQLRTASASRPSSPQPSTSRGTAQCIKKVLSAHKEVVCFPFQNKYWDSEGKALRIPRKKQDLQDHNLVGFMHISTDMKPEEINETLTSMFHKAFEPSEVFQYSFLRVQHRQLTLPVIPPNFVWSAEAILEVAKQGSLYILADQAHKLVNLLEKESLVQETLPVARNENSTELCTNSHMRSMQPSTSTMAAQTSTAQPISVFGDTIGSYIGSDYLTDELPSSDDENFDCSQSTTSFKTFPSVTAEKLQEKIGFSSLLRPDNKNAFVQTVAAFYIHISNRAAVQQFKEGLDELGVLDAINGNMDAAAEFLCGDNLRALTPDELYGLFTVEYSGTEGSNIREKEMEVEFAFLQFLSDCATGEVSCTLADVLQFISGMRTLPPGGLLASGHAPVITFKENGYPTTSTCALRIDLPRQLPHGKTFSEMMVEAVRGSLGGILLM